ncbi:unnamed protein product [Effrenium voratum]|nr:unnamed protein product [Effrenium voratum]
MHADGMGRRISSFAEQKGTSFHVVVCSPYARCVQTAVKICKQLGPGVKMLIDLSLGEIYGPSVMGEVEPRAHLRSFSAAVDYCNANGVSVVRRFVGDSPVWPESLQDARRRFALRFLQYLQRGVTAKRNFVIITHGDCIGSVMGIMPDQQDRMVEKVDYGAIILGSRAAVAKLPKPSPKRDMSSVLPLTPQEEQIIEGDEDFKAHFPDRLQSVEEGLEDCEAAIQEQLSADKWAVPVGGTMTTAKASMESEVSPFTSKAMSGWHCETMNIASHPKKSKGSKLARRLTALVESGPFSMQKVEKLLGAMGQTPLGDSTPQYSTTPVATRN